MHRSLALVVLSVVGVACSSASSERPSEASPSAGDRLTLEASNEARDELGVERWGIDVGAQRRVVVRGYDHEDHRIVELEQRIRASVDEGEPPASGFDHALTATLRVRDKTSTLAIASSERLARVRTIANDLDAEADRVLRRIGADLRTQTVRDRSEEKTSLTTKALHPTDALVRQGGICLARSCSTALYASASASTDATMACRGGGADCAGTVANANESQGASDTSCDCGKCTDPVTIEGPPVEKHVQTFADEACCLVAGSEGKGACRATTYAGHRPSSNLALDMPAGPKGYGSLPEDNGDFGHQLAEFSVANKDVYRIAYVIYRQRINMGSGWEPMEDRGSITQNHFDHVHVSFEP